MSTRSRSRRGCTGTASSRNERTAENGSSGSFTAPPCGAASRPSSQRLLEFANRLRGRLRLLDDDRVTRAGNALQPLVRQQLDVAIGGLVRHQAVVLGADDERRARDAAETPLELAIGAPLPHEAGDRRGLLE